MKKNLVYLAAILMCTCVFLMYVFVVKTQADTRAPEISFPEEIPAISVLDPETDFLQDVTAYDKADGDVTDSLVVASVRLVDTDGTVQVTYAAFDKAGNVAQAVRQGVYTDYESPRFSLSTSLTFSGSTYFDIFDLVHAEDQLDGNISHRIRITSMDEAAINAVGMHEVELQTSNSLGETVNLVVPVEVYAPGTYDASLTLKDYLIYLPVNGKLDAKSYLEAYTRAGMQTILSGGMPAGFTLDMKNNVRMDVPGVYTVEYRVTQTVGAGAGATAYTGYAKLIVVVEG